ncbi:MAG TPA: SLC13 family permease, partial [Bacteroidia bacterium]|nr:SLC13 family permease [Bacteroidia bacterium]
MLFNLIPIEFILFGVTLLGIVLNHKKAIYIGLTGMIAVLLYSKFISNVNLTEHFIGNEHHEGEWRIMLNLFGLLTGFSILAAYFEKSELPQYISTRLSHKWYGHLTLLIIVFILSSFLDNIAAAMIGGSIAHVIYKGKVHIGFLAAIVAASNAGGAGSVIGDTTTTMMWIEGVAASEVLHAYIASISAFLFFAFIAS